MFRRDTLADLANPMNLQRLHLKLASGFVCSAVLVRGHHRRSLSPQLYSPRVTAQLHYLKAGQPNAAELLAPPPLPDSPEQAADMAAVVSVSTACSSNDKALALFGKEILGLQLHACRRRFLQGRQTPPDSGFFPARPRGCYRRDRLRRRSYWNARARTRSTRAWPQASWRRASATLVAMPPKAWFWRWCLPSYALIGATPLWPSVAILAGIASGLGDITQRISTPGRVFAQAIVREMKANHNFLDDLAEASAEITSAAARPLRLTHAPVPVPGRNQPDQRQLRVQNNRRAGAARRAICSALAERVQSVI